MHASLPGETWRKRQTVGLYIVFMITSPRLALGVPFNMLVVVPSIAQTVLAQTPLPWSYT